MSYNLIKVSEAYNAENFPHSDDYKRWSKQRKIQGKKWKYWNLEDNPIYFKTNSMGYRTHNFDFKNDKEYIMTFGCSNTYGLYLHEQERYSNLIEAATGIKTYNLGICGGSANMILMNVSNFLYTVEKKPVAIIIQWPDLMRINLSYTEPEETIYRIRANSRPKQNKMFYELVKAGNILETHSLWAKNTTSNIIDSFGIKSVQFAKDIEESKTYDVPYLQKIDTAYDNNHIGSNTNKEIFNFVLKGL